MKETLVTILPLLLSVSNLVTVLLALHLQKKLYKAEDRLLTLERRVG
jgi:hypothetical protein